MQTYHEERLDYTTRLRIIALLTVAPWTPVLFWWLS